MCVGKWNVGGGTGVNVCNVKVVLQCVRQVKGVGGQVVCGGVVVWGATVAGLAVCRKAGGPGKGQQMPGEAGWGKAGSVCVVLQQVQVCGVGMCVVGVVCGVGLPVWETRHAC